MTSISEQFRKIIHEADQMFGLPNLGRITPDEALELPQDRDVVFRARSRIVGDIIDQINFENGRCLEVGTGTCELQRLIDKTGLSVPLLYSDLNVERVRRHSPHNAPIVNLDIDRLPFAPSSLSSVIALNVIDQCKDVRKASLEISRVLQPGGQFITLTDLLPDEYVFFRRHKSEYLLPFQAAFANASFPYVAFTKKQAEKFGNLQLSGLREFWFEYMKLKPVERALISRITRHQHILALQENLVTLSQQGKLGFEPMILDMVSDFHLYAAECIGRAGYSNVQTGLVTKSYTGDPVARQITGHEYSYSFDLLTTRRDSDLGKNVKEIASMGVIVAQK